MGFKNVSIEDLEMKLTPNFLGVPLKHIEKMVKQVETEVKKITGIKSADILLFNEESLEYSFDNEGKLKNFIGTGFISAVNNSKKDRIWDTRLQVSESKNTNLNDDEEIILGNLEPETNKKINYTIIQSNALANPIKITENIEILNIESEFEEKLFIDKDLTEKAIEDDFNVEIKSVGSTLDIEKEKLENASDKLTEWTVKKESLADNIKTLKETREKLIQAKSDELNLKLIKVSGEKIKPSDEGVKEKRKDVDPEIKSIIEEFSKREISSTKKIEADYDQKIKNVNSQIDVEQRKLDEIIKNLDEWTIKKQDYNLAVKNLKKELNSLEKEKTKAQKKMEGKQAQIFIKELEAKILNLNSKLDFEQGKLDEAIKETDEWSIKKKESNELLKNFKSEFNSLNKAKNKTLNATLKNLAGEKNAKIKEKEKKIKERKAEESGKDSKQITEDIKIKKLSDYKSAIRANEKYIDSKINEITRTIEEFSKKETSSTKKIEAEYGPKIKSVSSQNDVEQRKLDEIVKNLDEWTIKKQDSSLSIKELKKEINSLEKDKSKAQKKELGKKGQIIIKEFEAKIVSLNSKLDVEQGKFDEAVKETDEFSIKKKESNEVLKNFKNELNALNNAKSKTLNAEIKKHSGEKNAKVKDLEKQIKAKEAEISNYEGKHSKHTSVEKTISDKYDPEIKGIEAQLSEELAKLDEATEKTEGWTFRKSDFIDNVDGLENQYGALVDANFKARQNRNYLLLFNKNNSLKYSITLENNTKNFIENVKVGKFFSKGFTNFKCKSSSSSDFKIDKENIIYSINEIKPGEKIDLSIFTDISPSEKIVVGTGDLQLSYDYRDYLISRIEIERFSAYSHTMHAINIEEKEDEPYKWDCSLLFRNNSDLNMELNSILVLDEDKQQKYIDFSSEEEKEKIIISPGDTYFSEKWEVYNESEPKFYRKLDYSVTHDLKKKTSINLRIEENVFDIIDFQASKRFSITEIKSFEKAQIENQINIKNTGSIDIDGIIIEEIIPADFLPSSELSDISIRNSSGILNAKNVKLRIDPEDNDSSKPHVLQLILIGTRKISDRLIKIDDFLEVKYIINAMKPDYKKKYEFPLKIVSYYPKYKGVIQDTKKDYYKIYNELNKRMLPKLKVIHKRRNLIIGKSIFPGRNSNEFGISVIINNKSNVEVNDIKITDTISKSFELISSNIEGEIVESEDKNSNIVTFIVDSILPYQEKEIRYYLQNIGGEEIGYDKLESYIFG